MSGGSIRWACELLIDGRTPCRRVAVYEVQVNHSDEWSGLCAEHTAKFRADHVGVTGVRQVSE